MSQKNSTFAARNCFFLTKMLKISIITVTRNSAETLADAMDSVLRQSYRHIEYIIVDGNSTDNSVEVIKSYEERFEGRLRWISEKDDGIYNAMNKGVRMATGDIVGILNSDDFLSSDTVIEKMVAQFDDNVDAIYGDVHFVHPDNLHKTVRYYSGSIFRPWLLRFGFLPPHPSLYVRRRLFEQYGYYDDSYQISADYEFIMRLCLNGANLRYLHLDFVTMRIGGASTRSWKARLIGAKENLKACRQNGIRSNYFFIAFKYPIKIFESIFIKK